MRYDEDHKPQLESGPEKLEVVVYDGVLGANVVIDADAVVLATGVKAPGDGRHIAQLLKIPLNQEGFFLEAHAKLRPVDFSTDGVFVAGLAHGPKTIAESIAQAQAAVSRAVTIISKDEIEAGGPVAQVDPRLCSACGACEEVCQFQAIKVNAEKGEAQVEAAVCKGCGSCAATCRCGAITLKGFTDEQILAEVVALT